MPLFGPQVTAHDHNHGVEISGDPEVVGMAVDEMSSDNFSLRPFFLATNLKF